MMVNRYLQKGIRGVVSAMCAGITLLAAVRADANAFRNPPPSAAGLALDGGKSVLVDDASAATINPANLMGIKGNTVMASVTIVDGKTDYTGPAGSASTDSGLILLSSLYGAMPIMEGRHVLALALTTPYGQSVEWPRLGPAQPYFSEMVMVNAAPTFATRINDWMTAGVGVNLYASTLEMRQPDMRIKGDGTAVGANIGVACDVMWNQKLTLTYTSPFDIEYSGDATITGIPKSDFESKIKFPSVVVLGWGMPIGDKVRVAADVEWVEFSRNKEIPMDYGVYNLFMPPETRLMRQDWDDVFTYGVAGTYAATECAEVRLSYRFMESPIPDATHSVALPDADKHIVALGVGWRKGGHQVDLGYAYSILDDRRVAVNGPYDGEYDLSSSLGSVSYSYSF